MEANNLNVILKTKIDDYGRNYDNWATENEITVTITLNEYRNLVTACAKADERISKATGEKWKVESINKELEERIHLLEKKLISLTANPVEKEEE